MAKKLSLILFLGSLFMLSCRPDEIEFTDSPEMALTVSADTILFDTILTNAVSITERLRVFNPNSQAVRFDATLAGGNNSDFNIAINGVAGDDFNDVALLGGDSLLILVNSFINASNEDNPFIVEDSVIFDLQGNLTSVKLLGWGQNANYLSDSVLICNTVWDDPKPYVIFNSVLVDSTCSLTIRPGVRVFSHLASRIFVQGTLTVEGTIDNRVQFLNDRFDEPFNNAPGQWGGIYFLEGSHQNNISNAVIRNSEYGIWLGTPDENTDFDLTLENVIIENISRTGLISFTSDLSASNLLINNCGEFCIGCLAGGNYSFNHTTLGNFGFVLFREGPSLVITDQLELADGSLIQDQLDFKMQNSIVWGDLNEEVVFSSQGDNPFNTQFNFNVLRTSGAFDSTNLINTDPLFVDPINYNYRIDTISPAVNFGIISETLSDIEGVNRDTLPDLGAYEIDFN